MEHCQWFCVGYFYSIVNTCASEWTLNGKLKLKLVHPEKKTKGLWCADAQEYQPWPVQSLEVDFNFQSYICSSRVVNVEMSSHFASMHVLQAIHTLRVHYAHAAANLNLGYSKYAKVARVHYFCTIALRTSHAVLTRAWALRRVYLRERTVDLFSKRVIIFCWWYLNDF